MIKVLRENVIKQLASIKDDNVSIAGIAIERRKLLEALRLQNQAGADMLTIDYGNVSWEYEYETHSDGTWELAPYAFEPKPCIQISCDHTVMRFMNHAKSKGYGEPKIIPLNFVDRESYTKPELTGIPLDTRELINVLTYVLHGVAIEEGRPVLCCVLFDSGDNVLKLVSADGFRLPMVSIPADGIPTDKVLIHSSDINKLLTFLKSIKPIGKGKGKCYPEVYLQYDYKVIKFAHDNGSIELAKKAGTFPDYSQLIPTIGTHIQLVASDMLEAVKAVNVMARDGSGIIRLKFNKYPSNLTVSAKSEEAGNSAVECLARVDKECHIAVNAKYLMDFLKTCGDNIIDLFITTPSSPMVMHDGIDKSEVVMPMFVQW